MTAPGTRFGCPQCGLKLRIQADSVVERRIACPRCEASLRVRFEPHSGMVEVEATGVTVDPTSSRANDSAVLASHATTGNIPTLHPLSPEIPVRSGERQPGQVDSPGDRPHSEPPLSVPSPTLRRWLAGAGLTTLFLCGIGLWSPWLRSRDEPHSAVSQREVAQSEPPIQPVPATSESTSTGDSGVAGIAPEPPGDQQSDPARPARERLLDLDAPVGAVVDLTGSFPPAVVGDSSRSVESRLSWLAFLARQLHDNPPPIDWMSDWNAPVNDRFVRRRLVGFQNPLIPQLTGEDGYPAGHFVGVAGVGPEVLRPEPPFNQVGVFAPDRQVSLRQIRDGLAQTVVVTGAQAQLGSWGAGGRPTIRSFQSEPVIGGPDGLGTGLAESLLVLMADGRVQTVGSDIDPGVFRRLLTIAGEVSEANPSELGTAVAEEESVTESETVGTSSESSLVEGEPLLEDADHPPLAPEFAGDDEQPRRQVNLRDSLAQKLVQFEQPIRSRRDVLRGLRDLVGVPLRFEGADLEPRLKQGIGFTLRDVTVQQVLERTLAESGLNWRIEQGQIVIFVADSHSGDR